MTHAPVTLLTFADGTAIQLVRLGDDWWWTYTGCGCPLLAPHELLCAHVPLARVSLWETTRIATRRILAFGPAMPTQDYQHAVAFTTQYVAPVSV